MSTWILVLAFLGLSTVVSASKFHVTVNVDKHTTFAALHTYALTPGWSSFNQRVDAQISAAIERELSLLGLTRQPRAAADVLVTYGVVRRTNVDVNRKRKARPGVYAEYPVATLVVLLREPFGRRELFRARAELHVDIDTAQLGEQIDAIVARMFARYPTGT